MTKVIDWILFFAVLAVLAVYGGSEAQPAKTPPPAWMRRMNAVEAEQAARDAEAVKAVEEADRTDWHPPYEPIGD